MLQLFIKFQLRCGFNNCREFNSAAAPEADCCIDVAPPLLSAEEGVGEQFDVFFKAGEMGTISPSSQSSSPSGALVTWNVVVDPEVVDTKTSIKFSFISIDIPSTKKVDMNRGRNRKKKKKRNRRKHRGKHGSKQKLNTTFKIWVGSKNIVV